MARFTVDFLDVLTDLLRPALPGVTVMTRIPDHVPDFVPLVVVHRTGGSPARPDFYDSPYVNVQNWCAEDDEVDAFRAASDLADKIRGILWTAYRTQQVIPGRGWINSYRESTSPIEISDPDLPHFGRYSATYDLRFRAAP